MVSVIIPTYNRAELLKRALNSVAHQSFKDFEVIVVDDGSTDNTADVVEKYKAHFPLLYIMQNRQGERRGVAAMRNSGARLAQGQWLAFLDSDDEWVPDKLKLQIQYAQENPQYSLIHSEESWIRNGVKVNVPQKYKKYGGDIFLKCLPVCAISPSTVLIKKDFFQSLGGFNESYEVCEDYHLWLKITRQNPVGFVNEALTIKYGGHSDQLSQTRAMDYYRVKALDEILREVLPVKAWKEEVLKVLHEKCEILLQGYEKHKNVEAKAEIQRIKDKHF